MAAQEDHLALPLEEILDDRQQLPLRCQPIGEAVHLVDDQHLVHEYVTAEVFSASRANAASEALSELVAGREIPAYGPALLGQRIEVPAHERALAASLRPVDEDRIEHRRR